MTEEKYQEFLKTAPENHFSDEFMQFLRDNNEVVYENDYWIIIQNKKYWTPQNDWVTAFYKGDTFDGYKNLQDLIGNFFPREWLIKAPHKRTVKLFHVHLYKKV